MGSMRDMLPILHFLAALPAMSSAQPSYRTSSTGWVRHSQISPRAIHSYGAEKTALARKPQVDVDSVWPSGPETNAQPRRARRRAGEKDWPTLPAAQDNSEEGHLL